MESEERVKRLRINERLIQTTVEKLETTFQTEKGKIFVLHLVRAFIPLNVKLVKEDIPKNTKCCLTNVYLKDSKKLDNQQVIVPDLGIILKDANDKFIDKIEKLKENIPSEISNPRLPLYSETSDKLLTFEAALALNKYVMQEILKGNKEINFVVNQQVYGVKPKKKKSSKTYNSGTTLGDVVDFDKIKKKLKNK